MARRCRTRRAEPREGLSIGSPVFGRVYEFPIHQPTVRCSRRFPTAALRRALTFGSWFVKSVIRRPTSFQLRLMRPMSRMIVSSPGRDCGDCVQTCCLIRLSRQPSGVAHFEISPRVPRQLSFIRVPRVIHRNHYGEMIFLSFSAVRAGTRSVPARPRGRRPCRRRCIWQLATTFARLSPQG